MMKNILIYLLVARQVLKCRKYSVAKVWQSHLQKNNGIDNIDLIINVINSIISSYGFNQKRL